MIVRYQIPINRLITNQIRIMYISYLCQTESFFFQFTECEYNGKCYAIGKNWIDRKLCKHVFCKADPGLGAIYNRRKFGMFLKLSYKYITSILQLSYNYATIMLQLSYDYLTIILQLSYSYLTFIFQLSYSYPTVILQLSYNYLSFILQVSYNYLSSILQVSYNYLTSILQLFYNYLKNF